ncbi:hypothetical protein SAMN05421848_0522 [Kushneria avicenniae]|uniref:DUF1315 domain-containing protein n=1 Tax=Kushneria avicenniae TaxID=402385 RepID=A0A1I1GI78_9GAMM|nr:DUF1315 family protein [Kushneria avicenniae]SFC09568.1 hypothetical protein SAMN05421848_0522 [Kushneria avicenniae]
MSDRNFERMIEQLTPQMYEGLKRGVELGKWPDGRALTSEQRELCLEAILRFEAAHNVPPEQRTGHIDRHGCGSDEHGEARGDSIKWVN